MFARDYTADWAMPSETERHLVILISSEGSRFKMSKTPLRVHSPFFHDMFNDCLPSSSSGEAAEIRMSESAKALTPILDYIYKGRFELPDSCDTLPELAEVLRACDKFRIASVPPQIVADVM